MPAGSTGGIIVDGTVCFDGGVDSLSVPTIVSALNPNGLKRNGQAWLNNCGVRDGGIMQRTGWQWKGRIHDGSALYQGGIMYEPLAAAYPYLINSIGGHIIRTDPDFAAAPLDLSAGFGLYNPATEPHGFFCQGEEFLIVQAGDNKTLPLFWDNVTLRRSLGITNNAIPTPAPGTNEIPAATAMCYYMGRFWYAQGRTYSAGDIVANHNSGTAPYQWRDSILNVTENPLCFGGDGFTIPTQAGNIRALFYNANLNTQLGQGQLLIGTRKAVYTLQVPQSRTDWINATANNQPAQTVVQLVNGPVNDRSVVQINGDVFYQTLEPGITSLLAAIRDFQGWGNHAISSNEDRVLAFNDRALLLESSGIAFDNRLLQTALPKQKPQGVVHQALIPLDFVPISNFNAQQTQTQPIWEGIYEGLHILQMFTGDFGGLERAFAVTVSRIDGGIDLWELTDYLRSDFHKPSASSDGEARVTWVVETPAWTWAHVAGVTEFDLKELETLELWIDKLYGEVIFKVEWRPDSDPCWRLWREWKECEPRTSCEAPEDVCYPLTQCREGFRATMTLPKPPTSCGSNTGRPAHIGYQHQLRLTIKGWARLRGLLVHATKRERELFKNLVP